MNAESIMIVEDEALLALKIKNDLLKEGYSIAGIYASGEEALEAAKGSQPSLALMDIHLQGKLDGIETAEALSKSFHTPVVFLTAHSDDDTVGAAMKTAPYGYLLKPVNAHELQIAIKVALSKSALEREDARKRTELERIFLHDIMNIAGGIHGISSLLGSRSSGQLKPLADIIEMASGSLVDEIKAQRLLIQAEKGELVTHFDQICALEAIRDAVAIYKGHEVAKGKNVVADGAALEFTTDKTILLRVLGNMLKNALEATEPGGAVWIRCALAEGAGDEIEFEVRNEGVIAPEIQAQIFNRVVSTKGEGRGLGTYSVKLLGEKYLKGRVGFVSNETDGTRFTLRLKRNPR